MERAKFQIALINIITTLFTLAFIPSSLLAKPAILPCPDLSVIEAAQVLAKNAQPLQQFSEFKLQLIEKKCLSEDLTQYRVFFLKFEESDIPAGEAILIISQERTATNVPEMPYVYTYYSEITGTGNGPKGKVTTKNTP